MRTTPFERRAWRDDLAPWCRCWLDAEPAEVRFEAGWQSAVVGLVLTTGEEVVVKVRRPARRVEGCHAVHQRAWEAGFPCPEPLVGPRPLGDLVATAERYVDGGGPPPPGREGLVASAVLLAAPMELLPPPWHLPPVEPPAWAWWDHQGTGRWPPPGPDELDMDAHRPPRWLASLVDRVQDRLAAWTQTPVLGHADWEAGNMVFERTRPLAVHDWDSACARPEAGLAGMASVVFPRDGTAPAATLPESGDFLDAYARAAAEPWMVDDHEVAWAAGLWVLAHEAWTESMSPAGNGPVLERLAEEAPARLRLAGA